MNGRYVKRIFLLILTITYGLGLYLFYFKYVPFIQPFQIIILPVLFCVLVITLLSLEYGTLLFVFLFPLINSLPYFFGIHDDIPHAPTALILFLFFFLGVLLRISIFGEQLEFNQKIIRPLILFSFLILVSGLITFLRYSNYYPILSDSFHEFSTNTRGVSAGGAIMSVVFSSLNYLTGFAFFVLLLNIIKSRRIMGKLTAILCFSSVLAIGFGLFQLLVDKELGNNLTSIKHGLVNGTFKDAMSFSIFIVLMSPLLLSIALSHRGIIRIVSSLSFILAVTMIFYAGSKIGLVCVLISLSLIIMFLFRSTVLHKQQGTFRFTRARFMIVLIVILGIISATAIISNDISVNKSSTVSRMKYMLNQGVFNLMVRWRGPLWKGAFSMLHDYPISGVGAGAYIIEAANYQNEFFKYETPQSAENYFLQVGAEFGIIGLILVIWIFFQIGSTIKKRYQSLPSEGKNRYLIFGAGIGIIVYFINIWFHTYIGSYEVKYTFWLLAAILFTSAGDETVLHDKIRIGKAVWLLVLTIVLSAGGTLLWNSTHSLSLENRTREFSLVHSFGFYPEEKTPEGTAFNWTKKSSGKTIRSKKPVALVHFQAAHPDIAKNPVRLKLSLLNTSFKEKIPLDTINIKNNEWQEKSYDLSQYIGKNVILLFEVDRTWNPKKILGTKDPRNLGIAVQHLHFKSK